MASLLEVPFHDGLHHQKVVLARGQDQLRARHPEVGWAHHPHERQVAGEQFLVEPLVKTRNNDKIVESKLLGSDRSSVPFNYRMHLVGDKWKIVDIYLNGYVSQLALRRADFSSTIASSGAPGLVKKINEMVDKQMNGG
jgi:hypothetical protein